MMCKKCKVEMQMQVVAETKPKTLGESIWAVEKKILLPLSRPKQQPTVAVTYAVCPKCGQTKKIEKKKNILGF